MIKVVLVDDHAIVRRGIRRLLDMVKDVFVVGEAANGVDVMELVESINMDLLLMDVNMPNTDTVDLIRQVNSHRTKIPILLLTMHDEPVVAMRMLKAGAHGYITKDCEPEDLIDAIHKTVSLRHYLSAGIATSLANISHMVAPAGPQALLSVREYEIYLLLVGGHSVNAIAEQLFISNKTVSTHKARLMEKLAVTNLADLTRFAMEHT